MYGLTPKELAELRLKCLEPFVVTGSKLGIEQDQVFRSAEKAFEFMVEPLKEDKPQIQRAPARKTVRKRKSA